MKATARVVDDGRNYGYLMLDGEHSGVTFVADDQSAAEARLGTEVLVKYHPADQFAVLVPFHERIVDAIVAAGLPVRFCGLSADWIDRAWHLGPSNDPCRVDGDVYLLEGEEGEVVVVARKFPSRDDETAIEVVAEELALADGIRVAHETLAAVVACRHPSDPEITCVPCPTCDADVGERCCEGSAPVDCAHIARVISATVVLP